MISEKPRIKSATLSGLLSALAVLAFLFLISEMQIPKAVSEECKTVMLTGHGSATSKKKAERNAKLDLKGNVSRRFPGDSKRHLIKGIGYQCDKSVLWLCQAKITTCE